MKSPRVSASLASLAWPHEDVLGRLRGYVLPLTTPFTAKGLVDLDGVTVNVKRALHIPGATGLYIGSVYQEFWTLTIAERKELAEAVVKAVDSQLPVVVGVSASSIRDSLVLAHHAEECGADLIMAWPPIWGPRGDDGVLRYYEALSAAVTTPLCVYSTTLAELGYYLTPDLLARLADLDHICAVKEASFDLTRYLFLLQSLGDRLAISTPFEEYWLAGQALVPDRCPSFLLGSSRALYMQSAEQPALAEVFEAGLAGDVTRAFSLLRDIRPLIEGVQMSSFVDEGAHPIAAVKYALDLLGMVGGPVRDPTPALGASGKVRIRALLADAGLIDP